MGVQAAAYSSGLVVGIPITITPMIAAAFMHGSTIVFVQNLGANPLLVEVAFGFDGLTWVIWPTTEFSGPDGNGLPANSAICVTLPDIRPPYVRLRARATLNTTDAQIDVYRWIAPVINGQFVTPP